MSNDMLRILKANDDRLRQTETKEVPLAGSGAAFPASPAIGRTFFRTDLGFLCYYDGTRWLTVHEYMIGVQTLQSHTGPGILAGPVSILRTDYAPYFTRVETTSTVATTNNATNYWQVDIITINLTFAAVDVIYAYTTAADAMGTRVQHAANASTPNPTNRQFIRGRFTTVGAPGVLEMTISAWYRLVIT